MLISLYDSTLTAVFNKHEAHLSSIIDEKLTREVKQAQLTVDWDTWSPSGPFAPLSLLVFLVQWNKRHQSSGVQYSTAHAHDMNTWERSDFLCQRVQPLNGVQKVVSDKAMDYNIWKFDKKQEWKADSLAEKTGHWKDVHFATTTTMCKFGETHFFEYSNSQQYCIAPWDGPKLHSILGPGDDNKDSNNVTDSNSSRYGLHSDPAGLLLQAALIILCKASRTESKLFKTIDAVLEKFDVNEETVQNQDLVEHACYSPGNICSCYQSFSLKNGRTGNMVTGTT